MRKYLLFISDLQTICSLILGVSLNESTPEKDHIFLWVIEAVEGMEVLPFLQLRTALYLRQPADCVKKIVFICIIAVHTGNTGRQSNTAAVTDGATAKTISAGRRPPSVCHGWCCTVSTVPAT